jgi:hypothetical protein
MQTYLAHTRQPWRLMRELGPWRLIGFHGLIGGFLLSVLAYPWLFVLLAVELCGAAPFSSEPGSWHHTALLVALVDLAAGFAAALLMMMIGVRRGNIRRLASHIATAPCYWLLVSLAGYRALVQIIHRPHLWEKTAHAARRRTGSPPRPPEG